jgi:serine O-acetyltransferase
MIRSKADYKRFLSKEICNGQKAPNFFSLYIRTFFKPEKQFLLLLRTSEYYLNTNKNKSIYFFVKYLKFRLATRLGYTIPENVADEGLQLPHYGTIIINANARLGKYCRIHAGVNIGASGGSAKAPQIGDYVYFAPGAKVYGEIRIASRIAIAANAAVGKSFLNSDKLIGGIPAKEIGVIDIHKIIKI